MSYNLLHIAIRVHTQIARSSPQERLTDKDLAALVKARVGEKLAPSEKQIKGARGFLKRLGYPLEYSESEHRWFYNWENMECEPDCLDDLVDRMKRMPKAELACLFVLRHGLDALEGTPLWGEVGRELKQRLEEKYWRQLGDLRAVFSIRPQPVPVQPPAMFEAFAEAAYLGLQVEVDHVEGAEGEVRTARWDPLHLCQSEGRWHVVVLVPATNTLQTFPLSEVRRMESTGQPCAVVSVFEVRKYCAESFGLVVQRQNALQTP